MRPVLPLPPASDDGESRVHGLLLVRTDYGDDGAWADVRHRMGELPGLHPAAEPVSAAHATMQESIPRRLIVVDDPGWEGATAEEVRAALKSVANGARPWVPDLVLVANDVTMADAEYRSLLAVSGTDEDYAVWLSARHAAMLHLVLHRPSLEYELETYPEDFATDPEWRPGDDEDDEDRDFPAGMELESLNPPPRYEPPARVLPPLTEGFNTVLVRTDFTDDAALSSLAAAVHSTPDGADPADWHSWVDVVDDRAYEDATPEQLMAVLRLSPEDEDEMTADVLLIADGTAMRAPGQPVLVVPLADELGRAFRVSADLVSGMVVNLALANMDIDDWRGDDGS
ncbi:hypothetical protein GCM10027570_31480 [Streptomonospora sediminis]